MMSVHEKKTSDVKFDDYDEDEFRKHWVDSDSKARDYMNRLVNIMDITKKVRTHLEYHGRRLNSVVGEMLAGHKWKATEMLATVIGQVKDLSTGFFDETTHSFVRATPLDTGDLPAPPLFVPEKKDYDCAAFEESDELKMCDPLFMAQKAMLHAWVWCNHLMHDITYKFVFDPQVFFGDFDDDYYS